MTSPLPAQNSKQVLGESKNLQQGGFLNFSASPKGTECASFQSLIDKNDKRRERQDEIEEAEASKKRRKALDAAAIAAQTQNNTSLQSEACLDPTLDFVQSHDVDQGFLTSQNSTSIQFSTPEKRTDSSATPTQATDSEARPESEAAISQTVHVKIEMQQETESLTSKTVSLKTQKESEVELLPDGSTLQNAQSKEEETIRTDISALEDSKDSSSGTESATTEDAMVSLATFEDTQSSAAPKAASETSITSANRLSTIASVTERKGISSIENVDSGGNSFTGDFSTGNPSVTPIHGAVVFQKNPTSQASSLLKLLAPELEKFQQTGESQIQLELPVGDNEFVKIRLSLRAGEIRSTFITESPELREALQKAWPDFTATHRAQGIRFGDSQFQDSFTRNQDAASEQGRQRQYQQESLTANLPSKQQAKSILRPTSQGLPNQKSSSSNLNLWA